MIDLKVNNKYKIRVLSYKYDRENQILICKQKSAIRTKYNNIFKVEEIEREKTLEELRREAIIQDLEEG